MINAKSLDNKELYELMQAYRKKFKEKAFTIEMPTGSTYFPSTTTEEELIKSLRKCIDEDIKLYEMYPSLMRNRNFDNKKI